MLRPSARSPMPPSWPILSSPLIRFFAWLWRPIAWFWLTLLSSWLATSFITILITAGRKDTPDLPVVRLAFDHPWVVIPALGLIALLTPCAWLGHHIWRPISPYVLQRVGALAGQAERFVPRYLQPFYLYRVADTEAREALRAAAEASKEETLGICVLGPPLLGKTRLAWEAIQAELPDRTLLRWPFEGQPALNLAAWRGAQMVLWLDDLQKYAQPALAPTLNDLPRRFAAAGVRLVIVATCRDDAVARVAALLGPLLERLIPILPADVGEDEAAWHATALQYQGIKLDRAPFDGTPGSLVLNVERMRQERYPALPKSAQRVLRAMKLLRSAGIWTYPEARVRATAEDVFWLEPNQWRSARKALVRAGFVRLERLSDDGSCALVPVADIFLDQAVPEAAAPGMHFSDGWRELEKSLVQRGDADALHYLALAFLERRIGNPSVNKQHAEACLRAALAVYQRRSAHASWAIAQGHLGQTHWQQAQVAQASERAALLTQAILAYRAALRVGQWEGIALHWAETQQELGAALSQRATLAEGAERLTLLRQAVAALDDAQAVYTRMEMPADLARAQERLGAALSEQARLAEGAERAALLCRAVAAYRAALAASTQEEMPTHRAHIQNNLGIALLQQAAAAEGAERVTLLEEARAAHQAALAVYTAEDAPRGWASAQSNLGNVLRHQAELAEGPQRATLLAEAVAAYQAALKVSTREDAPDDWASTQNNLGNALSDQAQLAQGKERLALLAQAAAAHQAALAVYTRDYLPIEWAGAQLNLAQVSFARASSLKGRQKAKQQALEKAQHALTQALTVFTADTAPDYHAEAIALRQEIEARLAKVQ
jgi:hypothetical protein